jgi:hypothetical protein
MKSTYYLLYICSSGALSAWLPFHGFHWKHILGTFVRICMENVYWESVWKTYTGYFLENLYGKRILGTFVRICMENVYWGLSWESVWKTYIGDFRENLYGKPSFVKIVPELSRLFTWRPEYASMYAVMYAAMYASMYAAMYASMYAAMYSATLYLHKCAAFQRSLIWLFM